MKILRQIFPSRLPILAAGSVALLCLPLLAQAAFLKTNLVSDIPGLAAQHDSNLVNPWGISFNPNGGPFWISDNHTGVSTVYNGLGQPFPLANPLVVTIPPPTGGTSPAAPTGQVFSGGTSFAAAFIFATEDGTISAWNGGPSAILKVTTAGAVYKGLAVGNNGSGDFLYAANFKAGKIDVFDSNFAPTTLAGNFTDPSVQAGYAPFNIQRLGNELFITYALPDANGEDDVPGAGHGYIGVFDLNGNLKRHLVSDGALNSPWGLALAPVGFGEFGNDLLVGNFGNGTINAFDPSTGALLGHLLDIATGNPIVVDGLWGLQFGNGGNGGDKDKLYFTAGIPGDGEVEDHGLFGSLSVPEPGSLALMSGVLAAWLPRWRNSRTKPTNRQVA